MAINELDHRSWDYFLTDELLKFVEKSEERLLLHPTILTLCVDGFHKRTKIDVAVVANQGKQNRVA